MMANTHSTCTRERDSLLFPQRKSERKIERFALFDSVTHTHTNTKHALAILDNRRHLSEILILLEHQLTDVNNKIQSIALGQWQLDQNNC